MRFSIVITCYNQRAFIRDAVDSALFQRKLETEVIVVDDGSSDGAAEILEKYGNAVQLVRFSRNSGVIAARNHGASRARGEYLVFLDGDDALMPWALYVYEGIIAARNPKIILAKTRWVEGSIPPIESGAVPHEIKIVEYEDLLLKDRPIGLSASSYVVEREAFWRVGGWSAGIFHLDLQDLSMKLACSGKVILVCSPSTAFYRVHPNNSINDVRPFLHNIQRLMAKERNGEYPGGSERQLERRAWFGGLAAFWVKRAMRAGLAIEAARVAASGWTMILPAIAFRSRALILGRRPIESINFRRPHRGS